MMLQTFIAQHNYDPVPYFPLLFMDKGESKYLQALRPSSLAYQAEHAVAQCIREDYELPRSQLFIDAFIRPLEAFLQQENMAFKLQVHGGCADHLDAYQLAEIPESEGLFAGGSYDFFKLALHAAHIVERNSVNSQTFVNNALRFDALTLEDYYLLMRNAFAAGITQTVAHGDAYHYPLESVHQCTDSN